MAAIPSFDSPLRCVDNFGRVRFCISDGKRGKDARRQVGCEGQRPVVTNVLSKRERLCANHTNPTNHDHVDG